MDRFAGEITEHFDDAQDIAARVWHSHYRAELERRQEAQKWAKAWKMKAREMRDAHRDCSDDLWIVVAELDDARAWARRMKRERDYAIRARDEARADIARLREYMAADMERARELKAENARLRELIKSVEWVTYYSKLPFCPHCKATRLEPRYDYHGILASDGRWEHSPDCPAFDEQGNVK